MSLPSRKVLAQAIQTAGQTETCRFYRYFSSRFLYVLLVNFTFACTSTEFYSYSYHCFPYSIVVIGRNGVQGKAISFLVIARLLLWNIGMKIQHVGEMYMIFTMDVPLEWYASHFILCAIMMILYSKVWVYFFNNTDGRWFEECTLN